MAKLNISIDRLKNDLEKIVFDKNSSYLLSYSEFIRYFENLREIKLEHMILGSHLAYGWMPRVLDLKIPTHGFDSCLTDYLNKSRHSDLSKNELEQLKYAVNNSMVGLSKLLHFISPERYAIWDSRVYRYITSKNPYNESINKVDLYLEYLGLLNELKTDSNFSEVHAKVNKRLGYSVSWCRALEVIMFQADKLKEGYLDIIFYELPSNTGLRGNEYLWYDLKSKYSKVRKSEVLDFQSDIEFKFKLLTGRDLTPGLEFEIDKYKFGGLSSGQINTNFWIKEGIPFLKRKLESIDVK